RYLRAAMHLVGRVLVRIRNLQSTDARLALREPDGRPADTIRRLCCVVCDDHAGNVSHVRPVSGLQRICACADAANPVEPRGTECVRGAGHGVLHATAVRARTVAAPPVGVGRGGSILLVGTVPLPVRDADDMSWPVSPGPFAVPSTVL